MRIGYLGMDGDDPWMKEEGRRNIGSLVLWLGIGR